jgi:thiosulfate/3-mercaptopyruvate sulfurtransferase
LPDPLATDPDGQATIALDELVGRLGDPALAILDVRRREEYAGNAGYPCDPRQGHIPGARHVDIAELLALVGGSRAPAEIRELVGVPANAEIVAYCHSGVRSAHAAVLLAGAGYRARNYVGSWHEWSRQAGLPIEP